MSEQTKQQLQRAKQKQLRSELGCSRNGNLPVKVQKNITYSINVRRPLKPEERVQRDPLKKKPRRPCSKVARRNQHEKSIRRLNQDEDFIPLTHNENLVCPKCGACQLCTGLWFECVLKCDEALGPLKDASPEIMRAFTGVGVWQSPRAGRA